MRLTAAVGLAAAYIVGLATYEVVPLVVATTALIVAVISLIQGTENRRDLRTLLAKQNDRAGRLVEGLEGDVANGDD